MMTGWLVYILLTIGLVYLFTQSVIWSPIRIGLYRKLRLIGYLLYCPSCTGFWVGVALCIARVAPGQRLHADGLLCSGVMSMAIAQMWSAFTQQGVNPAWEVEQDLREPEDAAHRREHPQDAP